MERVGEDNLVRLDNPEVDMLWPEFLYLKRRLEEIRKRKEEVLT